MIADRLNRVKKLQAWTISSMAERLGVTRGTVFNYLCGKSKPDTEKLLELCKMFNVSADYLIGNDNINVLAKFSSSELLNELMVREVERGEDDL